MFVSAEFERMLEWSNEEIRGKHFTSVIHPEDLGVCIETLQVLEKYGRADSSIDFRVAIKSGGYKWVTSSAVCRFDSSGNPMHIIGMAHELTRLYEILEDLTRSETALRLSEERYRSLFEALAEGVVVIDKGYSIIAINRSAKAIFEIDEKVQYINSPYKQEFEFIHEDGSEYPLADHPSLVTLRSGVPLRDVVMGIQKVDGLFKWISINTVPIYYSDKKDVPDAVIASFIDITQIKKDREELIRNQQLLALENERYIAATKAVAHAVVDAQEKERAEIGVELHDNVNQILTTSRLYLDLAVLNEENRVELITRSSAGLAAAVTEIRKICQSLVPASLHDLGLVASIEDLVETVKMTRVVNAEFYHRGDIEAIATKSKLVLFRIIQEQVTNVLKHAQATNLIIELVIDNKVISLSISDNGKGFDSDGKTIKKGVGLYNIDKRAELLNGKMKMITSPGNGCKLNILIPI